MDNFFASTAPGVMMNFMIAGISEEKKQKMIVEIEEMMDRSSDEPTAKNRQSIRGCNPQSDVKVFA